MAINPSSEYSRAFSSLKPVRQFMDDVWYIQGSTESPITDFTLGKRGGSGVDSEDLRGALKEFFKPHLQKGESMRVVFSGISYQRVTLTLRKTSGFDLTPSNKTVLSLMNHLVAEQRILAGAPAPAQAPSQAPSHALQTATVATPQPLPKGTAVAVAAIAGTPDRRPVK